MLIAVVFKIIQFGIVALTLALVFHRKYMKFDRESAFRETIHALPKIVLLNYLMLFLSYYSFSIFSERNFCQGALMVQLHLK